MPGSLEFPSPAGIEPPSKLGLHLAGGLAAPCAGVRQEVAHLALGGLVAYQVVRLVAVVHVERIEVAAAEWIDVVPVGIDQPNKLLKVGPRRSSVLSSSCMSATSQGVSVRPVPTLFAQQR